MRLGIKLLDPESTVNDLKYIDEMIIIPGETTNIVFQLFKEAKGEQVHRYIPPAGSVLDVNIYNIDPQKILTKTATQPFADDKSIWSFSLNSLETQNLSGVNIEFILTEGTVIKKIWAKNVLSVYPKSPFQT